MIPCSNRILVATGRRSWSRHVPTWSKRGPPSLRPGLCGKRSTPCIQNAVAEPGQDDTVTDEAKRAQTLYELMGVGQRATPVDIKVAYRQLARTYHPDVNKSATAEQTFQAISLAYEVLCDVELRKQYDVHGFNALHKDRHRALLQFFGKAEAAVYRGPPPERGDDVYTVVGLSLGDAVTGTLKVVSINVHKTCQDCRGSGVATPNTSITCQVCRGNGKLLRTVRRPDLVQYVKLGDCPACAGKGIKAMAPCLTCSGDGRSKLTALGVQVSIPAGVSDGNVMRVPKLGNVGRFGGRTGDLYIKLQVYPSENLERQGQDLHSTLHLDLYDALLGGRVCVDTPRGERMLTVPQGTQVGDVLQLDRAGVAISRRGTVTWGHHFFTVRVVIPDGSGLSDTERGMLQTLSTIVNSTMDKWWQ